ncbi:D-alanine--D-alanine ligase B [Sedimentisphaera cyanobacteriorum]|uniref:D-alanine--D-alanine ligase n=1 Tax=Sedimentisphaera cyanobacteriorum TaxID=1940790 RepID=A0A1Q2HSG6_9BACT|nr:D-alanine--D-alanine ligase [Sedimentisphaera cyanobacteriorum]AQQ10214.1 D-alanine--D-alanine ligase B [Sedimentisphaera cyanobacteriorum]
MDFSKKIAVLAGGIGSEREVSLESGQNALSAIKKAGYNAELIDVSPETIEKAIGEYGLFFIMLHGTWGEDGQIQKILENRNAKFTGSGSLSSQNCFDKDITRLKLMESGIECPFGISVDEDSDWDKAEEMIRGKSERFVVKPACEGSSVGVEIRVGSQAAVRSAKKTAEKYGKSLIESYIQGKEFTVGIAAANILPSIKIQPQTGFYDYNAKYISDNTGFLFGAADKQLEEQMQQISEKAFNLLECRDLARVDFMIDSGKPLLIEVNTIPGFTSHSLLPAAAEHIGISQPQLCSEIIQSALSR